MFVEVAALHYQHHTTYVLRGVDNGVPQLSQTLSEFTLDYEYCSCDVWYTTKWYKYSFSTIIC